MTQTGKDDALASANGNYNYSGKLSTQRRFFLAPDIFSNHHHQLSRS